MNVVCSGLIWNALASKWTDLKHHTVPTAIATLTKSCEERKQDG